MKRLIFVVFLIAAITLTLADTNVKQIIAFTPQQVRWFTPSYYNDGRERAQLFGDSSQGGAWVDRVKMPAGKRVLAHTHPQDELVTVIEGTWVSGRGSEVQCHKSESVSGRQFHCRPGGRIAFCCGEGRYGDCSAQRQRQFSDGLC